MKRVSVLILCCLFAVLMAGACSHKAGEVDTTSSPISDALDGGVGPEPTPDDESTMPEGVPDADEAGEGADEDVCTVPPCESVSEEGWERLLIDDGTESDAKAWVKVTASVASDKTYARRGDSATRIHIGVDWLGGESGYPIGWPRTIRMLKGDMRQWGAWDYLEFSIYAKSTQGSLPEQPLGLILYGADNKKAYERDLTELQLDRWTDFRIPTIDLPAECGGIHFYVAESRYHHGEQLDFWIDNVSLVRSPGASVVGSRLSEESVFADSGNLAVEVLLTGVKPGESAEVAWKINAGEQSVAGGAFVAPRGRTTHSLTLPKNLAPGTYDVVLQTGEAGSVILKLMVVSSPWQEGIR